MNPYCPDRWAIIKIVQHAPEPIYKLLSGWYGGYAGADEWRLNSGIIKFEYEDKSKKVLLFHGYSGSVYHCATHREGFTGLSADILLNLKNIPGAEVESISFSDFIKEFK